MMKKWNEKTNALWLKLYVAVTVQCRNLVKKQDGFGLNEVLGIAAAIIVAGIIFIPQLKTFATSVITSLTTWWSSNSTKIFQSIP